MMSGSRKEFDVKQILRIRWRWFGHPASPPPHSPALGDFFSGRNAGASADSTSSGATSGGGGNISCGTGDGGSCINNGDNRKFLSTSDHPVSLSAAASVCLRSFSEGDCRSSPPPPWACPQPEVPGVEPVDQGCARARQYQPEGAAEAVAESEEDNINMDSESSSYRSSNSSQTLSSSQTAEPCVPEELFQSLSHAEHTFHKMETYLRHKQLCDVVLLAGERRIPAHRLVLSSVSDYFGAMFTSNVREAKQEEVKMEGVDPDALWALVQYAYTGRLELREDTVESLLAASCLLQLSAVAQACCSFLVKQLHPSNCLGIRSFADAQGCQDLLKLAHSYAMEHFLEVTVHPEFLLLPPGDVERLLSSDDVNVPDEEAVVGALLSWVRHDGASRRCHLPRLLAHVRLPLLTPQYLADLEGDPLLLHSADCQRLLMEAMKFHLLPERRMLVQSPRTRPRKATVGALFAVGGMDATKGATTIEQYCPRRDSWRQVAVMSGRRLQCGVAVLEERLYVVGGRDGLKTLNTVECYNPRSKSWSAMPPMATNRHGLGVAVLEGPMYAVGGHDGWSYLSSVERWDPQTRQWSFVASMGTPRSTVGVAVLAGKLYAVGGRDGSACLSSVECFDPHTNKWSGCSPMTKRRGGVGVATWSGFLYAVGGHDAAATSLTSRLSDCVERYDPKTNTWTAVASMSISRDAVGVCQLGERLYAVGGYDGQSYLDVVETYDPQTNEWTQVAPLCLGRAGTCVVAVKL
ncbi:kelch-like protein 5 [Paramormyrops kingsleyae]|uniref:Kelch-like family member 5 n=1 Tax=Paramormyrops kingsleyae TaxID=1676925 RepID=A0A3B3SSA1_9TELE|nr:kelch-like protein 5 [Paramormyrops kingsleyae]